MSGPSDRFGFVVTAGLLLTGVSVLPCVGCGQAPDGASAAAPSAPAAPVVDAVTVRTGDVSRHVQLPAELAPWREVALHARASGYLKSLKTVADGRPLEIGDEITSVEGDDGILATVDVPELEAEVARRKAEVVKAGTDVAKARADVEAAKAAANEPRSERVSAEALIEKAAGAVRAAEADEQSARTELELAAGVHDRYKRLVADRTVTELEFDQAKAKWQVAASQVAAAAGRVAALKDELKYARARLGEFDAKVLSAVARIAAADAAVTTALSAESVARAALAEAEAGLAFRHVRAPFPGVIVQRFVDPGAMIRAGGSSPAPLLLLSDRSRLRVLVDVPEGEVRHVAVGTAGLLTVPEIPGISLSLPVARSSEVVRAGTRTQRIELDLVPGKDRRLVPGLYGQVRLTLETHKGVVIVPAAAVGGKGAERFVFVHADGKAVKRPVVPGFVEGKVAEVLPAVVEGGKTVRGVTAGETVLVPATGVSLQDGQTVTTRPATY